MRIFTNSWSELFRNLLLNRKSDNVRVILALAAHYDWEAHQVDVQTAFLNAPLKEDVYMTTPEGVHT